jgi:hypothetical protein
MIEGKIVERLHNSKDFYLFLKEVHEGREFWVRQLHDIPTERLQQISGRILALDEVLDVGQYKVAQEKWRTVEQ